MTDQQFEDLAKLYPDLFLKAQAERIDIGVGWIPILKTLFDLLSYKIEGARRYLKFVMDEPDKYPSANISDLENTISQAFDKLPSITQIKEKYGTLRIYYINSGCDDETQNYIHFSEAMSSHVCEECGCSATTRNLGSVKTLCERHHRERENEYIRHMNPINYSDEN